MDKEDDIPIRCIALLAAVIYMNGSPVHVDVAAIKDIAEGFEKYIKGESE